MTLLADSQELPPGLEAKKIAQNAAQINIQPTAIRQFQPCETAALQHCITTSGNA